MRTWLLPLFHPARLASNAAAMRAYLALEALAIKAGRVIRTKQHEGKR